MRLAQSTQVPCWCFPKIMCCAPFAGWIVFTSWLHQSTMDTDIDQDIPNTVHMAYKSFTSLPPPNLKTTPICPKHSTANPRDEHLVRNTLNPILSLELAGAIINVGGRPKPGQFSLLIVLSCITILVKENQDNRCLPSHYHVLALDLSDKSQQVMGPGP
jgi:hypothetical protein